MKMRSVSFQILALALFVGTAADAQMPDSQRALCQQQLTKSVCLTKASQDDIGDLGWNKAKCDPKSAQYVPTLMSYYDEMPAVIRPTFCTLKKIFISDDINSVEFTGYVPNPQGGRPLGAYIGIAKDVFTLRPTTHDVVTWKEQAGVFASATGYLKNDPTFPQISYNLKLSHLSPDNGFFYVLMHEMGHVIDAYNSINTMADACSKNCPCSVQPGWLGLSWQPRDPNADNPDMGNPLPAATFLHQLDLCWEGACSPPGAVALADATKYYESLQQSAFPTSYSGFNETEDFAENFAWYLIRTYKSADYHVSIPGQGELDMNGMFTTSPMLAKKQAFIGALLSNPGVHMTPPALN